MINRRHFIQTGLAGSALAAAGAGLVLCDRDSQTSQGKAPATLTLHSAVVDRRFAASIRFGRRMERHGVATSTIWGDVTELWYSGLQPQWRKAPVPIAGLTSYATLFCLERLAWDHGMRVIYSGSHASQLGGDIEHRLASTHGPLPALRESRFGSDSWPIALADLIARLAPPVPSSVEPSQRRFQAQVRGAAVGSSADAVAQPLYSWVIALPRRT